MVRRLFLGAALAALMLVAPAAASAATPVTRGSAAIVVDAASGKPLLQRHPDRRRPIASTTKLMTALLTLERANLNATFTAPGYSALPAESKINLRRGERMKVRDLLTALLLESANDAAVDLAVNISGSRSAFVRDMNRRARALGLRNTHYANPIGLDDRANYSSARDLATLARKLMADKRFASIVRRPRAELHSGDHRRVIGNRNRLVGRYSFVDGIKTGHTIGAGYILVGAAHGHGGRVISVVLGEPSEAARDVDTLALLRWGIDRFQRVTAVRAGRTVARLPVKYHDDLKVRVVAKRTVAFTLHRGEKLKTQPVLPDELEGPLAKGVRVGSLNVLFAGQIVRSVPVITARAVPGPTTVDKVTGPLGPFLTALALLLIVTGGVLIMLRLRSHSLRSRRAATPR